jgi:hypothetical protein
MKEDFPKAYAYKEKNHKGGVRAVVSSTYDTYRKHVMTELKLERPTGWVPPSGMP